MSVQEWLKLQKIKKVAMMECNQTKSEVAKYHLCFIIYHIILLFVKSFHVICNLLS